MVFYLLENAIRAGFVVYDDTVYPILLRKRNKATGDFELAICVEHVLCLR
jgi:hypothetical protein